MQLAGASGLRKSGLPAVGESPQLMRGPLDESRYRCAWSLEWSIDGGIMLDARDVRKERVDSMPGKQATIDPSSTKTQHFIQGLWGVRYQVKDVERSITFYTQTLGFNLDMHNL